MGREGQKLRLCWEALHKSEKHLQLGIGRGGFRELLDSSGRKIPQKCTSHKDANYD